MDLIPAAVLRTEVASELPNVPNPAVEAQIVHGVRMLCEQAALWQVAETVATAGDVLDLSAMENADRDVVRVMPRGVSQDGVHLPQYVRPDPADDTLGFYIRSRRRLVLTRYTGRATFEVTAQMRPAIGTSRVPADVVHDYHEPIVHAALYRLLRMPHATWADGEAAAVHYQQFMRAARAARSEVHRIYVERSE